MRVWRRLVIGLGVLVVLAAVLPLALVEGLYRYGLAKAERLPDPPAPVALPALLREAIWVEAGGIDPRTVEPQYPWTIINRFFLHYRLDRPARLHQPPGEQLANHVEHLINSPAPRGVTGVVTRAAVEFWLTRHWTADQLVDAIAQGAYFGAKATGVNQAAATYFGKPVGSLSPDEIALIIGLLQSPASYNPACHPDAAKGRRYYMLGKLRDAGVLSEEEFKVALARPIVVLTTCSPAKLETQPSARAQ
jgi:hypothetical protein